MAQQIMRRTGRIQEIIAPLEQQIVSSGMSCERVDAFGDVFGGVTVWVLVYEKYFMRASNRATLTLTLIESGGVITANVMASGGGSAAIHRFSWGVEESFAQDGWNALAAVGFTQP
ncbi:MAG TPA: hypothetical protein H9668_07380 [Firmicutes bacterium]|nr:hypothetical protein [Bacillota bacterium]